MRNNCNSCRSKSGHVVYPCKTARQGGARSQQKMHKHAGTCLCGEISFEVIGEPTGFFLCHCSRCRKVTGSAHAANIFVQDGQLNWLSGEQHVKLFQLADTRFAKSFCDVCGSALPFRATSGRILIPAGVLDGELAIRPKAHIQVASRASWDQSLELVAHFDTYPI